MNLELCDRVNVVQTISVILTSMAELSQLKDGFSALGVAESVSKYPDLLYSFYCMDHKDNLTAGFNTQFDHQ